MHLRNIILCGEFLGSNVIVDWHFQMLCNISPVIGQYFVKSINAIVPKTNPVRITKYDFPEHNSINIYFQNSELIGCLFLSFNLTSDKHLKLIDSKLSYNFFDDLYDNDINRKVCRQRQADILMKPEVNRELVDNYIRTNQNINIQNLSNIDKYKNLKSVDEIVDIVKVKKFDFDSQETKNSKPYIQEQENTTFCVSNNNIITSQAATDIPNIVVNVTAQQKTALDSNHNNIMQGTISYENIDAQTTQESIINDTYIETSQETKQEPIINNSDIETQKETTQDVVAINNINSDVNEAFVEEETTNNEKHITNKVNTNTDEMQFAAIPVQEEIVNITPNTTDSPKETFYKANNAIKTELIDNSTSHNIETKELQMQPGLSNAEQPKTELNYYKDIVPNTNIQTDLQTSITGFDEEYIQTVIKSITEKIIQNTITSSLETFIKNTIQETVKTMVTDNEEMISSTKPKDTNSDELENTSEQVKQDDVMVEDEVYKLKKMLKNKEIDENEAKLQLFQSTLYGFDRKMTVERIELLKDKIKDLLGKEVSTEEILNAQIDLLAKDNNLNKIKIIDKNNRVHMLEVDDNLFISKDNIYKWGDTIIIDYTGD